MKVFSITARPVPSETLVEDWFGVKPKAQNSKLFIFIFVIWILDLIWNLDFEI